MLTLLKVPVALQKYSMPYRNTQFSISVGVTGTEVLATTQASDVKPGHGKVNLIMILF